MNVKNLRLLLHQTGYDQTLTSHLITGFTEGFDLGYQGPQRRTDTSNNLPFRIGTPVDLWNKVMDKVEAKRYAGPFTRGNIPFEYFIQSPLGLVPKAENKQRLIFHLSYDFGPAEENKSVNYFTPDDLCTVKYKDLDYAVRCCLQILNSDNSCHSIFFSKSDFSKAFRILPILISQRRWLVMRAVHPITKKVWYFVDLCLPFGSSRSCALFQKFSDAIHHIVNYRLKLILQVPMAICNYLDDFLFMTILMSDCNTMVGEFLVV